MQTLHVAVYSRDKHEDVQCKHCDFLSRCVFSVNHCTNTVVNMNCMTDIKEGACNFPIANLFVTRSIELDVMYKIMGIKLLI